MTGFHNISFPLSLAFGVRGGPRRKTDIVQLASGLEHRNNPHSLSRRRYDAGAGIKSLKDLQTLIAFFEARGGQAYAFRFRDPMDHNSAVPGGTPSMSDQTLGLGDGVQTVFTLAKTYGDEAGAYIRPITKPVAGTVLAAVDGQAVTPTVDVQTGEITLSSPPPLGAIISAGYQFDVPARFDTDHLDIALEAFEAGRAVSIPLIEVLDHA